MQDASALDGRSPEGRATLGRTFFGLGVLASGALQIAIGGFVRLVPRLPDWVPAQSALAYVVGAVLVAIGLAIASGRLARTASTVLAALILAMLVLLYPSTFFNPVIDRPFLRGFMWTAPLKALALVGGAALVAGRWPDASRGIRGLGVATWERFGHVLLAAFLIVCGLQHFAYRQFVDGMVPAWIPPGQRFWTYFAGVALIAGGLGILVTRVARLAASLAGLMIFLWVILLHIPRAFSGPGHAVEAAGVCEALALSGVALLVAGTRASGPGGPHDPSRQVDR
jgi:uncharacterized membrane protein